MSDKRDANDVAAASGPDGLASELTRLINEAAPIPPAPPKAPGMEAAAPAGESGKPDKKEGRPDYKALALAYLHVRGYGVPGPEVRFRYRQEDYFQYDGKCFSKLARPFLLADVGSFLQGRKDTGHKVSNQLRSNVLINVESLCLLPDEPAPPLWIENDGGLKAAPLFLSMENGILDLAGLLAGEAKPLQAHTPRFFSTITLPYPFKPDAVCPQWLAFLAEVLPDEGKRGLIQEWFGYNLTPDTSLQRFLMLVGEGANGKSVICAALRAVLGEENVSTIPLSAFGAERNFQLEATIGKLANIQGDLGAISLAEEGQLKQFICGEPCDIDRKGRRSIKVFPSARLLFATNSPPFFKDRSDAIQRRMLYLNFEVQIPEERRKPGMDKPDYWQNLGELPGLFLWAVEGLKRLRTRGRFQEPQSCRNDKEAYVYERFPELAFIKSFVREDVKDKVSAQALYNRYLDFMKESGEVSRNYLTMPVFGKRVKKIFPRAESKPMYRDDEITKKARHWVGLRLLRETDPDFEPDENKPPAPAAVTPAAAVPAIDLNQTISTELPK